ncbi:PTS sugar transporter subunit IIA [Hirschia baltica]|uniref:Putative PTS IIA-like nitrogen-regulatory protein PtsN n=1 Tax=Hirschia baltica (strain ATCC 49814 / DSM 5838 / IFAM 1418) TaxID=582402 RepID=C6XLM1_HIRBI|nr:PTS sugar transporter subunit IIA [Hirschia baltica]ACT57927.1 putative PTS IIA-like nitrogen-regulatory protein PtsN [Hirschia baltica ATCC 49814]
MTDVLDLLHPETIAPRAKWGSRKLVISELAEIIAKETGLDGNEIFSAVMERERLGSTGVGEGVAIPHARIAGLKKPIGAFARLVEGVDFEAIDERDCDLVFLLLAPKEAGVEHLRALAKVSRIMRQEKLREGLRKALSVDAVLAVFTTSSKSEIPVA